MNAGADLLRVCDLRKVYRLPGRFLGRRGGALRAVDGVSFSIPPGGTMALVGESGSGKSTIGRTILRLEEPTGGAVFFQGEEITRLGTRRLRSLRRRMQIVFQDPFGSLHPRLPVGGAIEEVLRVHRIVPRAEVRRRAEELLSRVGLSKSDRGRYPHELSGGERQRVCIARAIASSPLFLVADEPISSLDVSIQAQIVHLLLGLKERLGISLLLITHNLVIVPHLAERTAVLYLGRIVEEGPTGALFRSPLHPYTRGLLSAVPSIDPRRRGTALLLSGEIPSSVDPPPGCPFHPRCPEARAECRVLVPRRAEPRPGHAVSCHLHPPAVPIA